MTTAKYVKDTLARLGELLKQPSSTITPSASFHPHERSSQAGKRPVKDYAAVETYLQIRKEDQKRLLPYTVGKAPREGPVASPCNVLTKNIATLYGSELVDDSAINAYLALVCHHGNGHFDAADAGESFQRQGSPQFYAWPLHLCDGLDPQQCWNTPLYPAAKLEDVKHYFIPMHVSTDHWVMVHLSKRQGTWVANLYSGIPGFRKETLPKWSVVVEA